MMDSNGAGGSSSPRFLSLGQGSGRPASGSLLSSSPSHQPGTSSSPTNAPTTPPTFLGSRGVSTWLPSTPTADRPTAPTTPLGSSAGLVSLVTPNEPKLVKNPSRQNMAPVSAIFTTAPLASLTKSTSALPLTPQPVSIEKEGYLIKQGQVVKNWKKRWFVLKDNSLCYYKNPKTKNSEPRRKIYLGDQVSTQEVFVKDTPKRSGKNKKDYTFEVRTEDRTFIMIAESQSEMEEWLQAIQTSIANAHQPQQQQEEPMTVIIEPTTPGELDCERCCERIKKIIYNFSGNSRVVHSNGSPGSGAVSAATMHITSVTPDLNENTVTVIGKNIDSVLILAKLAEAGFSFVVKPNTLL